MYKLGDTRILNFPHFFPHLEMDWDIFMAETKTKAHVSLMSKGFKHAPISFAIIGEVFHDLEFLSLNEFLK